MPGSLSCTVLWNAIQLTVPTSCLQITLGSFLDTPTRSVEIRLKSPEKGRVKILAEPIICDLVSN
jgi:hypothetical protein